MREMGKGLIAIGLMIAAAGAFFYFGPKMPLRLGRLPGDFTFRGRNTTVYFPFATCLLVGALLNLILWLIGYLRK